MRRFRKRRRRKSAFYETFSKIPCATVRRSDAESLQFRHKFSKKEQKRGARSLKTTRDGPPVSRRTVPNESAYSPAKAEPRRLQSREGGQGHGHERGDEQ